MIRKVDGSRQVDLAFGGLAALVLLVAGLSLKSVADANERFVNHVHDKPMSFARSSWNEYG